MRGSSTFIFCTLFVIYVRCSKYSKEVNRVHDQWEYKDNMERPFRMAKANLLWEKARKMLSSPKMADLYADLKQQDVDELNLKKIRNEGFDETGERQALVRNRFKEIMIKHDLQDHIDVFNPEDAETVNKIKEKNFKDEPHFMDKKLRKLWKKALDAGFSGGELDLLKKEFTHYQDKLDEYEQLKNTFSKMSDNVIDDNSIEHYKSLDPVREELKNNEKSLKKQKKDLKQQYEELEHIARKVGSKKLEFSEPRVYDLWVEARRANFSDSELESFKEELLHFEHKVRKHDYLKTQADTILHEYKNKDKEMSHEHRKLTDKAKNYALKVNKYDEDFRIRIKKARVHSEL